MKSCDYCGRDNEESAVYCLNCGTEFRQATEPSSPTPDLTGLKGYLRYALISGGTILLIACLYLLSLGPVVRYCCTWKTFAAPTNTVSGVYTNSSGATVVTQLRTVQSVKYPAWVGIVYRPVLGSYRGGQITGLPLLYHRYLIWWEPSK